MREFEQMVVQVLAEYGVPARLRWSGRFYGWVAVDVAVSRLPPLGVARTLARRLGVGECRVGVMRGERWRVTMGWPVGD